MRELTLMLLYLSRFTQREKFHEATDFYAWKGYDFDILNELDDADYIRQGNHPSRSKSVYITESGMEQAKELFDVLDELCAQGKAEVDNKGRYSKVSGKRRDRRKNKEALKAEKPERGRKGRERREKNHEEYRFSEKDGTIMEGTFIGHYKGFGFVEVEDQEQDIFIPENDTGSAMHQDKVQILVRNGHKEGKRQEGVVLKVLERGMPSIVGTYQSSRDYGFVISDNPKFSKDIFISRKNSMGAKDGDKVVAEITDYGSRNRKPEGKITEVLGNLRSPGTDILAIVKSFNIPSVFPDKVLRQADRVPDHVLDADRDGRLDLRHLQTVVIMLCLSQLLLQFLDLGIALIHHCIQLSILMLDIFKLENHLPYSCGKRIDCFLTSTHAFLFFGYKFKRII